MLKVFMHAYRIKSLRKLLVLATLVVYSLARGTGKAEIKIRKKITIQKPKTNKQSKDHSTNHPRRITVWIHGTKSMSVISDFVHAVPRPGLLHIDSISSLYRIKSVMQTLAQTDPERFPLEDFYAFGWSGKLCFKKRQQEAVKLHAQLKELVERYKKKYGAVPHITLITHSHGGNVALNLATVPDRDPALRLELILLACPVQHETKELVRDSLFERIYSFYSPADVMQIIDPQGLYLTQNNHSLHFELSDRMFPPHCTLRQAQIEINGQGVTHLGFILDRTAGILPAMLNAIEEWEQEIPAQPDTERILEVHAPHIKNMSTSSKIGSYFSKLLKRHA